MGGFSHGCGSVAPRRWQRPSQLADGAARTAEPSPGLSHVFGLPTGVSQPGMQVRGRSRYHSRQIHLLGQMFPLDAGLENKEDASQCRRREATASYWGLTLILLRESVRRLYPAPKPCSFLRVTAPCMSPWRRWRRDSWSKAFAMPATCLRAPSVGAGRHIPCLSWVHDYRPGWKGPQDHLWRRQRIRRWIHVSLPLHRAVA